MATTMVNSSRGSAVLAPRYQARRTNALPKQTLFGSNVEQVANTETLEELLSNARHRGEANVRRYTPVLPEHLKKNIPGQNDLMLVKKDYERMKAVASKASKDLKSAEQDRLFFNPSKSSSSHSDVAKPKNEPRWFSKGDVENGKDINCLGLNSHESYNHHKYGKKPTTPEHKYKLMGDILQPRINNGVSRRSQSLDVLHKQVNLNNNNDDLAKVPMCHCYAAVTSCGNKSCLTCRQPRMNTDVLTKNLKKEYEELSHIQRSNTFPGYTLHQYDSLSHEVHTDDVYLKRDAPTDQFRCRKDAYSVWAEANLVREKMRKLWKETEVAKKQGS